MAYMKDSAGKRLDAIVVAPLGVDDKVPDANLPTRLGTAALATSFAPSSLTGDVALKLDKVTAKTQLRNVWLPNTAYVTGDVVASPSGDIVTCKSNFTSGSTYDPSKWTVTLPAVGAGTYLNFKPENFRKWRAAIARMRNGGPVARVSFIGDSNTNGYHEASNPKANYNRSYGYRTQQILDGRWGSTQRGVVYPIVPGASFRWDDGVVLGTGWAHLNTTAYGAGASGLAQATAATAGYLDYTPPTPVNSFTFWARKWASGTTVTYQIDAEAPVTVDLNNATEALGKYTITTGTVGTHKIRIQQTGVGTTHVAAFEGWDSTKTGPRFTFLGVSGGDMSARIGTVQGNIPVSNLNLLLADEPAAPDLVVLNAYINDHAASNSLTTYKSSLGAFIDKAQLRADVILVGSAYSGSGNLATWGDYRNAMLETAIAKGCGFIDMPARWGDYATAAAAPYNMWGDTDHPTDGGYWDMGEATAEAIKLAAGRSA